MMSIVFIGISWYLIDEKKQTVAKWHATESF